MKKTNKEVELYSKKHSKKEEKNESKKTETREEALYKKKKK